MSFFGSLYHRQTRASVVVDLGTYSVKIIVFERPQGNSHPHILKKLVQNVPPGIPALRLIEKVRELLFGVVKGLGKVPEKIIIALGPGTAEFSFAEWRVTPTSGAKIISRKEVDEYFHRLFLEHHDHPSRALFAYPLGFAVNGYQKEYLFAPSGRGRGVALERSLVREFAFQTVLMSLSPELGAAFADMKRSLGGMPVEFIPLSAAHAEAIRKVENLKHAFWVDVGGGETIIGLLHAGSPVFITSFPMGAEHFVQAIARALKITLEEARDIKRQYVQGIAEERIRAKLKETLRESTETWKQMFVAELDGLYHLGPLSPEVLLFGGGAYLPEVGSVLRSSDWLHNFSYTDTAKIKVLSGHSFFGGDSLGGFLQGPEDVGVASLMIYSMHHEPIF